MGFTKGCKFGNSSPTSTPEPTPTPTQPTDPTHPTDTTHPTDPTHPTETTHPTEPTHPTTPPHPTYPTEPTGNPATAAPTPKSDLGTVVGILVAVVLIAVIVIALGVLIKKSIITMPSPLVAFTNPNYKRFDDDSNMMSLQELSSANKNQQ